MASCGTGKQTTWYEYQATEKETNLLKTGIVELISWYVNEEEQRHFESAEYISISPRARDGGYELKICYRTNNDFAENNGNDYAQYFKFTIKNIKTYGNITNAELTDIYIESSNIVYIDDKASGTIEINHQTDLVKIVFQHTTYYQKIQYEMVWKQ